VSANTASIVVGRLLEIRLDAGYRSAQDVDAMIRLIQHEVVRVPLSVRIVTVVDWRRCPLMHEDATTRLIEGLRSSNARIERSAGLVSQKSAIAVLQFLRLVREGNFPNRRLFYDPEAVMSWLDEVLEPEERMRLRTFLEAGTASS
jgi:hypothetical protein